MLHLSMFEDVLSSCSFPMLEIAKPPGSAATEDFA